MSTTMSVKAPAALVNDDGQLDHREIRQSIHELAERLARSPHWRSLDLSGVVHKTWLKLFQRGFPAHAQTEPERRRHLRTMTRRMFLDEDRARSRRAERPLDGQPEPAPSASPPEARPRTPLSQLLKSEAAGRAAEAISRLPPLERQMIALRLGDERITIDEIAARLGISPHVVKHRLKSAETKVIDFVNGADDV